jgi:hypothetical protein
MRSNNAGTAVHVEAPQAGVLTNQSVVSMSVATGIGLYRVVVHKYSRGWDVTINKRGSFILAP